MYSSDSLFNGYNSNNQKDGLWLEPGKQNKIHQRSNILLGNYKNGIRDGIWVEYDLNNTVIEIKKLQQ